LSVNGTTYRSGTRFGPQGIRRISALYGTYNYELGVDLRESLKICDVGDVFTIANIEKGFDQISKAVAHVRSSTVLTALSSTVISGYVDTSAQWNLGTGNANAPAYLFGGPSKSDGFNLNVVKLVIAKDPTPSDDWGAGYKVAGSGSRSRNPTLGQVIPRRCSR
jgi:hypothetical protein